MRFLRAITVCSFFISFAMATLNPGQYMAIYNFGDSNSDTGAMSAAFLPEVSPFGMTFFKRPSGRACDGRMLIDFIADKLKYPFLSPYLDSVGSNFRRGANFATDGALVRRVNESWFERGMSPFPLDMQVQQFSNFKDRVVFNYQTGGETVRLPVPAEFANALYIIDIGQNDIAFGYAAKQSDQQIIASFPDITNQIGAAVNRLYQLGARNFWIHNTGPIGCIPITIRTTKTPPANLDPSGCIKSQNIVAEKFNQALKAKVVQLRRQLAQTKLTYVDIYTAKYTMITQAMKLGFQNPSTICCGIYNLTSKIPCGSNGASPCDNPLSVISWDGVHYSEAANSYVATQIFSNPALSDPLI